MSDPYTAAWLQELWTTVPEVPRELREEQRKRDRDQRRKIEDHAALNSPSTLRPQSSPQLSTGCAENGSPEIPKGQAKCA